MAPHDHALGLLATTLGRYDVAEGHFEEAARLSEKMAAPALLARVYLGWAEMLLRRAAPGDAERARDLACQALAAAEELGMARIATRARAILAG